MLNQSTRLPRLTKTKGIILASLIAGAMALPLFMPVQKAHADNDRHEDSNRCEHPDALLGSWIIQVSLDPATLPPGAPTSSTLLATFTRGGGFVEDNNGPTRGRPGGHGNWIRTGHRQFAATGLSFGYDSTGT